MAKDEARIGQVIGGKYRLLRALGTGGMGAVYEVENVAVGRRFALKLLHPRFAADPELVRRFRNEARRVAHRPP